jgi:hypothetical protein
MRFHQDGGHEELVRDAITFEHFGDQSDPVIFA